MRDPTAPESRLLRGTRVAAAGAVTAIAMTAMAGWWLGLPGLTRLFPGLPTMKFNTAAGLLLLGLALAALDRSAVRRRVAAGLAGAVAVLGAVTLVEYGLGIQPGIDDLFFVHAGVDPGPWPGRMAAPTAVGFILAGLSVLAINRGRGRYPATTLLALTIGFPALFFLFDLMFFAGILQRVSGAVGSMALPTAVAFLMVSVGLQAARPDAGLAHLLLYEGAVGQVARLFFLVLLPTGLVVIGGSQIAVQAGWIGSAEAVTLRSLVLVLITVVAGSRSLEHIARAERTARLALAEAEAGREELERRVQERTLALTQTNAALVGEIEERRRLTEILAESERRFRTLVEASPVGIVFFDAGGRLQYANAEWCRLAGRTPDELLYRGWLGVVHPDDQDRMVSAWRGAIASGASCKSEGRFVTPAGVVSHVVTRLSPVMGEGDRVTGFVGTVADVTAKRVVEHELRLQNEELERLLHVISHDLREPLRAVQSFARLGLQQHASGLDPEGRTLFARSIAAADRLDRLIRDIAELARAKFRDLEPEVVAARDVVTEALARLEARVREAGAAIAVAGDLPLLRADRVWATQAVYNLVLNALKFTQPGGAPDIRVAPCRRQGRAGLLVLDRGPGVPEEHADRIFGLFQRQVGRDIEGTGAGLAIVRQVARRHGGDAWVEPREGGGAAFFVTFGLDPAVQEAA